MIKDAMVKNSGGYDVGAISKAPGHSSPAVTQKVYLHWDSPAVRAAVGLVKISKNFAKSGNRS